MWINVLISTTKDNAAGLIPLCRHSVDIWPQNPIKTTLPVDKSPSFWGYPDHYPASSTPNHNLFLYIHIYYLHNTHELPYKNRLSTISTRPTSTTNPLYILTNSLPINPFNVNNLSPPRQVHGCSYKIYKDKAH